MREIPGYERCCEIYRGASYVVSRAFCSGDDSAVVVKQVICDRAGAANAAARLRAEYKLLSHIHLTAVSRPRALLETDEGPAFVLADAGRQNLGAWLRRRALPVDVFLKVAIQVAEILGLLHASHVIHRDLNPKNLVVGEDEHLTLVDFDAATTLSVVAPSCVLPPQLKGSLAYVAPEQCGRMNRLIDARADLYSLGATLYELATGGPPFATTDPVKLVHEHLARAPVPPAQLAPSLPKLLSDLVVKLLAKTPEERYQSAEAVLADLHEARKQLDASGRIEPFELGIVDMMRELPLPDTLYGRERESSELAAAFDRTAGGVRELVMVTGPPGVGKSVLVERLRSRVVEKNGHFVVAKSDPRPGGIPYESLVDGLRALIRTLLTAPRAEQATWRRRLSEALTPNARVIVDLIPDLERLIGSPPPVPLAESKQAENRFRLAFEEFLRVLATREHPLVLFADDLQWADGGSLKLLRIIAHAAELSFLMLVVAFRPAADSDASVRDAIEDLRGSCANAKRLELHPLDLEVASQLCSGALRCGPDSARELAEVLVRKTAGNPFFIKRLLRHLQQERSLVFAADDGSWHWDLRRVEAATVTDDVADLFVASLRRLPEATRRTLVMAACLGRKFSPDLLARLEGESPDAVAVHLGAGAREGLLVPLAPIECPEGPGPWFRFAHDRVQQAADSLLGADERTQLHLRVGRKLANELSEDESGDRLFEAVAHLDQAIDRIVDAGERLHLAELNARAAAQASASSVYGSALDLLGRAIALLPDDAWQAHHELAFSLHRHAVECAHLTGNVSLGERLFRSALDHVDAPLEKAALYDVRVVASTLAGDFEGAVAWGAQGLALTGVELPSSRDVERATTMEIAAVEASLDGRPVESLLDAPPMRAPEPMMAVQILSNLFAPTYFGRQDLYPFVVARTVNLTLAHGISEQAPFAFVGYGNILPWFTGDYPRARAFGCAGVDLSRRLGHPAIECRALGLFGTFVNNWRAPMRTSVPMLREAMQKGLESGELQYAGYWGLAISKNLLCQGVELSRFIAEVEDLMAIGRRTKMRAGTEWQLPFRQAARCLQGQTRGRDRLDDRDFDESAYVKSVRGEPYALSLYESIRLQILYLGGSFEAARAQSESARERLRFQRGTPAVVDHELYAALAMAACPTEERGHAIAAIEESLKKLEMWAHHAPENWRHKQLLVAAELERLRGRPMAAASRYDEAIDAAARGGFTRDEALAYELAGRFHDGLGRQRIAASYLVSAVVAYGRWGATAKSAALEQEFSSLPSPVAPAPELGTAGSLDLLHVLKAAEAISSVVELDRLLETLMELCLSTAGAERGALVLTEEGGPFVRVSGSIGETGTLDRTPLAISNRVPRGIVEQVARTGEPIVLADASRGGAFVDDPYVVRHGVRSAAAQPIRKQAKLVGVLYLENNLASRLFGPERLEVLQLLSSLMAISLENALLFEKMTSEVRERRRAEDAMLLLADAGGALVESLDHDAIIERVTRVLVPRLADACIVDIVDDGRFRRAAVASDDVERAPSGDELTRLSADVSGQCLRAGRSVLLPDTSHTVSGDETESDAREGLLRGLGMRSAMAVPLTTRRKATGVLTCFSRTRHFDPRDVTLAEELARRAALALQNSRLHADALEAVRMRDEFLAIASHELYTPLTSLVLATQHLTAMTRSRRFDADVVGRLTTTVGRQAERLRVLIEELLDVTRLTRGAPSLDPRQVDMRELVQHVLTDLRPELEQAKCEVRLHAPAPVQGKWDLVRVEQVVVNLLGNAIKFGAGKPIDVEVGRVDERARLSVRDHGIGIELARQERIFERFERAVSVSHYGGLGLGLYICRRIVEAHGGCIHVESRPGAGATFIVELPLCPVGAERH